MSEVSITDVRLAAHIKVRAEGTPPEPTEKDSERISMRPRSSRTGPREGFAVADVHTRDAATTCYASRGQLQRCVEVKGVWGHAASQGIDLTGNEILIATQHRSDYWLYVVDQCQTETGNVYGVYRDPVATFDDLSSREVIFSYPASALKAAREPGARPHARMIERWFPCAEVSEASHAGWGSGNSESPLFPWFAKRPLAQARAAVLTSLLPWPDDEAEQQRTAGPRASRHDRLRLRARGGRRRTRRSYHDGASMLDLFSGRAMIPLEAARYSARAYGIDYSPVATLAGALLADYPLRDWSQEPPIPFGDLTRCLAESRLLEDVRALSSTRSARRFTEQHGSLLPRGRRASSRGATSGQ